MLLEVALVVIQLSFKLASALSKLTLADLIFLTAAALRSGAGYRSILIIIELADIGKRRLLIVLILILVHILLENLRKLLDFSALKYVIGKSVRRSGNLVKSDLFKLLCEAVIFVYVTLESVLTSVGILTKRSGSGKALGVEIENTSLIFSALCESVKPIFLICGSDIALFCLCKLLAKVSNYLIVILNLLCHACGAKSCKSGERAESADSCRIANGHAENSSLLGAVVILNICRINVIRACEYAGLLVTGSIVNYKLGSGNFFNRSCNSVGIDYFRLGSILGNHCCSGRSDDFSCALCVLALSSFALGRLNCGERLDAIGGFCALGLNVCCGRRLNVNISGGECRFAGNNIFGINCIGLRGNVLSSGSFFISKLALRGDFG